MDGSDPDPYSLVSGLYGPGAFVCWLLTCASVIVSWNWNPEHNNQDCVDNDFLAFLSYPVVAAGHLAIQTARYPGSFNAIPKNTDPYLAPYIASLAASCDVCRTFTFITSILWLRTIREPIHNKRFWLLFLPGIFSFGVETNLLRLLTDPYESDPRSFWGVIFDFFDRMASYSAHLIYLAFFGLSCCLPLAAVLLTWRIVGLLLRGRRLPTDDIYTWLICVTISIIAVAIASALLPGHTDKQPFDTNFTDWPLFPAYPRSAASMLDLDQMFALVGGLTTLAFSAYDAVRACREKVEEQQNIKDIRDKTPNPKDEEAWESYMS